MYVRVRTYRRDRHSEMPVYVIYMFTMFVTILVRVFDLPYISRVQTKR